MNSESLKTQLQALKYQDDYFLAKHWRYLKVSMIHLSRRVRQQVVEILKRLKILFMKDTTWLTQYALEITQKQR